MKTGALRVSKWQKLDSKPDSLVPEFTLTSLALPTVIEAPVLVHSLCNLWG